MTFVMRVVGLPGDRVQMRQGHLHLNGAPLRREFLERADLGRERFLVFRERMPEGQSYRVIERDTPSPGDNTAEFSVPEGHYFVMGDNRGYANDRRYATVGYVPESVVFARADVVLTDNSPFRRWSWVE